LSRELSHEIETFEGKGAGWGLGAGWIDALFHELLSRIHRVSVCGTAAKDGWDVMEAVHV
jgi:hypothetical protein